jgi:hypothetical protein
LKQDIIQARLKSVFLEEGKDDESGELIQQFETTEHVRNTIINKVFNAEKEKTQKKELADVVEQIRLQENVLKNMLKDYKQSVPLNPQLLTSAMEYQAQVLQPLLLQRRDIQYRKMFVHTYADNSDVEYSRLYQYERCMDVDEFNTAEQPRVIHYKK